jgi:hypothetical protein
MPYASSSDVQSRLGRELTPEETPLVNTRLADAERMIRRRIPDLDAKVTAGTIAEADVVQVEADAVLRLVRNPDGIVSETDGNYTHMISPALVTGKLEITREEWSALGWRKRRMVTLVPTFERPSVPSFAQTG